MKKLSRQAVIGLMLGVFMASTLIAGQVEQFKKGDRVAIIGDSITHSRIYHIKLYEFYVTRFPNREFRMYNCGVSGGSTRSALESLEWDILADKPNKATILLGMNDFCLYDYGKDKTDEKARKKQLQKVEVFTARMTELVQKLIARGVKVILITPTIYDDTSDSEKLQKIRSYHHGANKGLGNIDKAVRKIAEKFNCELIDFHAPMDAVNKREQKKDPKFSLTQDRVHPTNFGNMVMLYLILKAQDMPKYVSKMVLNAADGKVLKQINCDIKLIKSGKNEVEFDCLEKSLPFPIPAYTKEQEKILPLQTEFNQETLKVAGLAPGEYEILIDGVKIIWTNAEDLAAGINLVDFVNTPMFKQAMRIDKLTWKRRKLALWLQSIDCTRVFYLDRNKIDSNNYEEAKKFLESKNWTKGVFKIYIEQKPHQKELTRRVEELSAEMYRINKPKTHRFIIREKGALLNVNEKAELVAYWSFDEVNSVGTAYDQTSYSNDGTITGATWGTVAQDSAVWGYGLSFNGSSDYVNCGDPVNGSWDFGTGDFTISAWVRTTSTGVVVAKVRGGGDANTWVVKILSGKISFHLQEPEWRIATGITSMDDGNWHYIVAVRKGANHFVYLDGIQDGSQTNNQTSMSNDRTLKIGTYRVGSGHFDGSIDEVRIYNRALSAAEVKDHYEKEMNNSLL